MTAGLLWAWTAKADKDKASAKAVRAGEAKNFGEAIMALELRLKNICTNDRNKALARANPGKDSAL